MSDDAPVFVVHETGERTAIAFRDWDLVQKHLYYLEESYVAEVKREIESISASNRCKVLAIDLANVNLVPSMFLAVLVTLSTSGLQIELLNPSESLLELLETTKLRQLFVCRDAASPHKRKAAD